MYVKFLPLFVESIQYTFSVSFNESFRRIVSYIYSTCVLLAINPMLMEYYFVPFNNFSWPTVRNDFKLLMDSFAIESLFLVPLTYYSLCCMFALVACTAYMFNYTCATTKIRELV